MLKKINRDADTVINREKKADFLEKSEHLMKVDQFIQTDLEQEELQKKHKRTVEKYRDSVMQGI